MSRHMLRRLLATGVLLALPVLVAACGNEPVQVTPVGEESALASGELPVESTPPTTGPAGTVKASSQGSPQGSSKGSPQGSAGSGQAGGAGGSSQAGGSSPAGGGGNSGSSKPVGSGGSGASEPPLEGTGPETPQPTRRSAPDLSLPSLPIGGTTDPNADGTQQCADVSYREDIPAGFRVEATKVSFSGKGLRVDQSACPGSSPACLDSSFAFTNSDRNCSLGLASNGKGKGGSVTVFLRGRLRCPVGQETACDAFVRGLRGSGSQLTASVPDPPEHPPSPTPTKTPEQARTPEQAKTPEQAPKQQPSLTPTSTPTPTPTNS